MFPPHLTKAEHLAILQGMSESDFARFRYCQEMGGTYLAVGLFETMLISAMHMCDSVKVSTKLGDDAERWRASLAKREQLQGSTLGSLIKILERHAIAAEDIRYLKWIKDKRDYFVHRLFHDGAWLGELDGDGCRFMTRRLIAIQVWLSRAERRIWTILERANLLELHAVGGGMLVMNKGTFESVQADVARLARANEAASDAASRKRDASSGRHRRPGPSRSR